MRIILLYLVLLISQYGQSQISEPLQIVEIKTDSIIKNGYEVNDTLYSGVVTNLIKEKENVLILFYQNGNIVEKVLYNLNGEHIETRLYTISGVDSVNRTYYVNGKLSSEIFYSQNQSFSQWNQWYQNGAKKSEIIMNDDQGISRVWYESGKLWKEADVSPPFGTVKSYKKEWCESGYLLNHTKLNQGKVKYVRYNCDSIKISEGTIINQGFYWVGKKEEWYDNGVKALEYYYEETNDLEKSNVRTGVWKNWDKNGNLIRTRVYSEGVLISEK